MKLMRVAAFVLAFFAFTTSVRAQGKTSVSEWTYLLTVDYDLALAEMVKAGKYDEVSPYIMEDHFPTARHGEEDIEVHLVHLGREVSSEEALRELDRLGFRPATLPELLALAADWPEVQRKYPIIALGSVWQDRDGIRSVPALYGDPVRRSLDLYRFEHWYPYDRFAAVRK